MLLLSELLSLPLYKDDFLIIKKKAGKKNKQENKDCSTFAGNQLKFNLSSHANTFFFFYLKTCIKLFAILAEDMALQRYAVWT